MTIQSFQSDWMLLLFTAAPIEIPDDFFHGHLGQLLLRNFNQNDGYFFKELLRLGENSAAGRQVVAGNGNIPAPFLFK